MIALSKLARDVASLMLMALLLVGCAGRPMRADLYDCLLQEGHPLKGDERLTLIACDVGTGPPPYDQCQFLGTGTVGSGIRYNCATS